MLNETQDSQAALDQEPLDIMTVAYAAPFHHFDAKLNIQFDDQVSNELDKNYWRVTQAFRYYVEQEDSVSRQWVYVPEGFLTDGATVPRPFWWLLPPWGRYGQAAVVHDILCETLQMYDSSFMPIKITREQADQIFLEAMKVAGVNKITRYVMYAGVRAWAIFGGKANDKRLARKRELEAAYNVQYDPQQPAAATA